MLVRQTETGLVPWHGEPIQHVMRVTRPVAVTRDESVTRVVSRLVPTQRSVTDPETGEVTTTVEVNEVQESITTVEPVTRVEEREIEETDEISHPPSIETTWSDQDLSAIGLYRVTGDDTPPYTGAVVLGTTYVRQGHVAVATHTWSTPTQADLIAYAADKRWRVETGGCLDPSGRLIATDRDSQTKLLAEMVAIGAGLRADPSPWKMRDGSFAILTNAEMLAAIMAARTHIAAAFAVEAQVGAVIATGTITTRAQIDAAAWPPNG